MKKFIALGLIAFGALSVYAKDIKELVVTTNPPMRCQNCENKIKGNLRFEKGIKKIETDLEKQLVTITYDADKTTETKIEEAFGKLEYQIKKVDPENAKNGSCAVKGDNKCPGNDSCCDKSK